MNDELSRMTGMNLGSGGGFQNEPLNLGEDAVWIEPRKRLLGNTFCGGVVSALLGPGAVGKTALRTVQALSLATGRGLTGEKVWVRCPVLYVCMEDDLEELRRRFRAAALFFRIDQSELHQMYIWSIKGMKLGVVNPKTKAIIQGPLYSKLIAIIKKLKIRLAILDPYIKLHEAGENDNAAMDAVMTYLASIAEETGSAIDILHHVGKGKAAAGDGESGRGASAIKDAVRLAYTATTMSPAEAQRFNIQETERKSYIRIDSAKVNISPADETTWFQIIGIKLGNATETYPDGDTVQTVRNSRPPEKTIGGVTEEVGQAILDRIDEGLPDGRRYSASGNAPGDTSVLNAILAVVPGWERKEALELFRVLRVEQRIYSAEYVTAQRNKREGLFVYGGKVKPPGGEPERSGGDEEELPFWAR